MTLKNVLRWMEYASRRWSCGGARTLGCGGLGWRRAPVVSSFVVGLFAAGLLTGIAEAQTRKVRVAVPGYTIAVVSFLAAKMNGYYTGEGLDVELIAMRAPTANLALIGGNVEFSAVPLAGLTTALRGAPLKLIFCQFDKPQHSLYAKPEFPNIKALRGRKVAVSGLGTIDDILLREALSGNGIEPTRDLTILAMGAADTRFSALVSGAIDASVLIAPVSFYAKDQGYRELASFQNMGFVLPSGGIVARDETLKSDAADGGKVRAGNDHGLLVYARQSTGNPQSDGKNAENRRSNCSQALRFIAADSDKRRHGNRRDGKKDDGHGA